MGTLTSIVGASPKVVDGAIAGIERGDAMAGLRSSDGEVAEAATQVEDVALETGEGTFLEDVEPVVG